MNRINLNQPPVPGTVAGGKRGAYRMTFEAEGPLTGLWLRAANALKNAGYDTRDKVRAAVLSGQLQANRGLNWFGPKMYAETLAWLGLEEARVIRHRPDCVRLPPLSGVMLEFVAPDYPSAAALPREESGYGFYVFAWNLAVLPAGSPLVKMIVLGIAGLPDEFRPTAEERLADLVRRKRAMFPDDPRVIGECRPVVVAGEVRLQVAWTTPAGLGDAGTDGGRE